MAGYKIKGTGFYTHLGKDQVTVDLPDSTSDPVAIPCDGEKTVQVAVEITADFYWTMAETAAIAATRIASDSTRCKWSAGFYQFDCSGNENLNLYLKNQTGGPTTDGVSYSLVEGD